MKQILYVVLSSCLLLSCITARNIQNREAEANKRVVVAYVTSWGTRMPNASLVTHFNYAFGHVTDSFDGVRVDNPERLKSIVALREQYPKVRFLISIGGWGSGRFSEMASSEKTRLSFAKDCKRLADEYNLDGIDIDWEYPTSSSANISSSPDDKANFTLLMRDIRNAIGKDKLLTFADFSDTTFVNYRDVMQYVDFVNIMSYDMADPPYHHSALYRSAIAGKQTSSEAVDNHLKAGVPKNKLVMGMPFYGRGKDYEGNRAYGKLNADGKYLERWDSIAQVPYLVNDEGKMILGYDNPTSIRIKCDYILENGLRGAMYWDMDSDDDNFTLSRTVWNTFFD